MTKPEPSRPDLLVDEDLDTLYEHAPCGYLSMVPDGTIVKANETLAAWLGVARDSLIGRRFQDLLTVPGRIFHDTHYMPLLAMQGSVREVALDLARGDGPPLPVILSTVARSDADGNVVLYRTTLFDCSDRRAYERELMRARRAAEQAATSKDALLATISHEMRSPLSSIIMASELLEGADPGAPRGRYLGIIKTAADTVLQLVNSILEHSKLESGTVRWEAEPLDLRLLTQEIAGVLSVKAEAKNLALRVEIDSRLPQVVLGDRFKLGQILTNLASNALKFTAQGAVSIDVRMRSLIENIATVELSVSDTGIGIPQDKLATIFDEYKQASATTRGIYGGTGLGLSIARRLAALNGGTVEVESKVGQGSRFWTVQRMPVPAS